jgi:hypothetical protein
MMMTLWIVRKQRTCWQRSFRFSIWTRADVVKNSQETHKLLKRPLVLRLLFIYITNPDVIPGDAHSFARTRVLKNLTFFFFVFRLPQK